MFHIENLTWKDTKGWGFTSLPIALSPGEALILKGANGAGKSTVLRLLAGLIPSTIPTPMIPIHYIGHKLGLVENLTVKDNLKIFGNLFRASDEKSKDVITMWHLEALLEIKVRHLSQGQKKRVALSRLHFEARSLWLLDEPTASLDSKTKDLFLNHLDTHFKQGGMAILALHDALALKAPARILNLDAENNAIPFPLAA